KANIVGVAEVVDVLASETPLHLDEDGAAQHGVGHLLALERDRLRAERREPPRLIRVGVAPHDPLPACPSAIDDLPQVGIVDKGVVGLVDDEGGNPFLDPAVECSSAYANTPHPP